MRPEEPWPCRGKQPLEDLSGRLQPEKEGEVQIHHRARSIGPKSTHRTVKLHTEAEQVPRNCGPPREKNFLDGHARNFALARPEKRLESRTCERPFERSTS